MIGEICYLLENKKKKKKIVERVYSSLMAV